MKNIDITLRQHNFLRKQLSCNKDNIFKSISYHLYLTTKNFSQVKQSVFEFAHKLQVNIGQYMNLFDETEISQIQDPSFQERCYTEEFSYTLIKLISIMLKARITVYELRKDPDVPEYDLFSRIENDNYQKQIDLLYDPEQQNFEPVFTLEFSQKVDFCQKLLEDILEVAGFEAQGKKQAGRIYQLEESEVFECPRRLQLIKENRNLQQNLSDVCQTEFVSPTDRLEQFWDHLQKEETHQIEQQQKIKELVDLYSISSKPTTATTKSLSSKSSRGSSFFFKKDPKLEMDDTQTSLRNLRSNPPGLTLKKQFGQKFSYNNEEIKEEETYSNKKNEQAKNEFKQELMKMKNEHKKKSQPIVIDQSKDQYTGYLKFFDEQKLYGFFVIDQEKTDLFVHYDDLKTAGVTKDFIQQAKREDVKLRFSFSLMDYIGKYKRSRKAIDIKLVQ